ncbi:MAG: type II toxin-antitoxin system HicB family antitoxin [Clostridiales bacterium]|jgi:predicted RNase H-like HicB family nuclease|nr:type II toxin-antitoxin system HicB family antitoxin [Clostridiales bacterium]
MRKATYLGVFEPDGSGGYGVYFPDLPGCASYGADLEAARREAADVLGLHLYGMEKGGDPIPEPSKAPAVDPETAEGYLVCPVTVFPDLVRNEIDNRSARTNITLPAWVKEMAEEQKLNISQIATTALMDVLGVQGRPG